MRALKRKWKLYWTSKFPFIRLNIDDFYGILGGFRQAQADDGIHSCRMALVAHIVPVHTARLAIFLLVADGALHEFIHLQILKRGFANEALFLGHGILSV